MNIRTSVSRISVIIKSEGKIDSTCSTFMHVHVGLYYILLLAVTSNAEESNNKCAFTFISVIFN